MIRKIDTLPPRIEKSLCELLLTQIKLKKEAELMRQELIRDEQFICLKLFKAVVFEGSEDPAK